MKQAIATMFENLAHGERGLSSNGARGLLGAFASGGDQRVIDSMAMANVRSKSDATETSNFIDTASCRCALRPIAEDGVIDPADTQAWRCTHDHDQDLYQGLSGKWFFPTSTTSHVELEDNEQVPRAPRPDTTNWYTASLADDQSLQIRARDSHPLSPLDNLCTGELPEDPIVASQDSHLLVQRDDNKKEENEEDPKKDATHSCLGGDHVIGVPIQNASSWNTVPTTPSIFYRPIALPLSPVSAPDSPAVNGAFEPFVCPAGSYCPRGGKQMIKCPAGHWCSVGFEKALKCSLGASCPPGTTRNMSFLPPAIILILDTMVLLTMVFFSVRRYFRNRHKKTTTKGNRLHRLNRPSSFFDTTRKYHTLGDDDVVLEPRITNVVRAETGFGGNFTPIDPQTDDDALISDLDLFIQSMSTCIGTEKFGLSFEFNDLKFQPEKATKPILSEVTGKIDRGSLWGVMGASGAGKSTFVNVLMGKTAHTGGTTKINGVPGDIKKYKKIIGYVPQDDIVLPELTVRENILHSARIRLPSSWTDSQIQRHVDILISCLQLAHVKDSLVGSAATPVISGGQRKRVSIGIELAAAPMALFLDEPTSGLDATSASAIMMTLKELSRLNITVITIIHQPRAEIFESLDSLILFGKGRVIYQGLEQDVQPYFENLGFHFPYSSNPADTIMDIIAGQGHLYKT
ncbi:MAG: hypothetical protein Q9228_005314, partial [Teloschistes exilis]